MTKAPDIRHAQTIGEVQALSDNELWAAIGACAPAAPVVRQYTDELARRASKAAIRAADAARWSAILAGLAIVAAAAVNIWAELATDPQAPNAPIGVYLTPPPS